MDEKTNRTPPQAVDVEQTVLGSMIVSQSAVDEALERLTEDCFYSASNRIIFSCISEMSDKNIPVDAVTLSHSIKAKSCMESIGGEEYLAEISEMIVSASNIGHYCDILTGKMMLRKLIIKSQDTISNAFNPDVDPQEAVNSAESEFLSISETVIKSNVESAGQLVGKTFEEISQFKKGGSVGVKTGFYDIDSATCGLQKSDLIIIAGRPSMGKTAFALSIALKSALQHDTKVLIFSLEMSKSQLMLRMMCSEANINMHDLRSGVLPKRELPKLNQAATPIAKSGIYIDDTPSATVSRIRATSRRHKKRKGLNLIIIDYLQLMDGKGENRQQEITKISRGLKGVAKELDVPVIALSQLSRGVEMRAGNHRPQLSDLRESGAIEQDADVVMFVYRDEVYNKDDASNKGKAEIIIGKQRNGPLETATLSFLKHCAKFDNLAKFEDDPLQCFRGGE